MPSSRLKSRRRHDSGLRWARILTVILGSIGAIYTFNLTLKKLEGTIDDIACPGAGDGCQQVLNSVWGDIGIGEAIQIPLPFFGLLTYIAVIILAIIPSLTKLSENKSNIANKSLWGLLYLTSGMSGFSIVLMWIMAVKLDEFCIYCVVSACICFALLLLTLIGGNWEENGKVFFRGFICFLVFLMGGLIWASAIDPARSEVNQQLLPGQAPNVISNSNNSQIGLAKHLKSTGSSMYSAYWCPHCHDQKELFGKEAVAELRIIECAEDGLNSQADLCKRKGITGYPSWEINNEITSGVKDLIELSEISNYVGTKDF